MALPPCPTRGQYASGGSSGGEEVEGERVDCNYKTGVVNEYFMWNGSGCVCSLHKPMNQRALPAHEFHLYQLLAEPKLQVCNYFNELLF